MQVGSDIIQPSDKNYKKGSKGLRGSVIKLASGGSGPPPGGGFLLQPDGVSKFHTPGGVDFIKVP